MFRRTCITLAMTGFALLTFSQRAHADDASGFYIGAGAGQISVKDAGDNTTGYKAFLGANFNPYVGIEAAYIDDGSETVGIYDPVSGVSTYGDGTVRAAQLSVLGKIPLSRYFALFARVDGIYWREDFSAAYYSYGSAYGYSASETGTSFGWGAGGEASFGHFGLRAEFEQADINSYTTRMISGSLIFRF
jgi:Outer membrane protein beta-barrel domain